MSYIRLKKIASFVNKGDKVLDIGADHCLVPYFLIKNNITNDITVSEISQNALNSGREFLISKNINNINYFHSDGFKKIENPNEFNSIIISGMGGNKISNILIQKKLKQPKLILYPTNNEVKVRRTLSKIKYKIINEVIVKENNQLNLVIIAKPSFFKKRYSDKNLFLGPILRKNKSVNTIEFYKKQLNFLDKKINLTKKDKNQVLFLKTSFKNISFIIFQ